MSATLSSFLYLVSGVCFIMAARKAGYGHAINNTASRLK